MIQGSLAEIGRYYSLHPAFERVIGYFLSHRDEFAEGRNPVDEANYVVLTHTPLRPAQKAPLEVHDDYIDIQILLEGAEESFGVAPRRNLIAPRGEMDRERDILFYDDPPQYRVTIRPGEFVAFFPEDAHAPLIGEGEITKAILKIKVE